LRHSNDASRKNANLNTQYSFWPHAAAPAIFESNDTIMGTNEL